VGRGDRRRVRWKADRKRKAKVREARKAKQRGEARKSTKK